jgi:hypothetical protein
LKELDMSNLMLVGGSQWPLQSKVSVHWLLESLGKAVDIYPFCTLKMMFRVYISWKNFVLTDFCLIPTMTRPGTCVSAVLSLNDWASRIASFVSMVDEQSIPRISRSNGSKPSVASLATQRFVGRKCGHAFQQERPKISHLCEWISNVTL